MSPARAASAVSSLSKSPIMCSVRKAASAPLAVAARLGRRFGRDLALTVADLGWAIRLPAGAAIVSADIPPLIAPEGLAEDILEGWRQHPTNVHFYPSGTWGPAWADAFLERDGRQWRRF